MYDGDRFKKIRNDLGFNQENMAKYLDCSVRSIKSYESGAVPSSEVLLKLAQSGIDTTWLLAGQVNRPNIVNIYNVEFSAGCGSFINEENIDTQISVPDEFFKHYGLLPKNTVGVYVRGDSMEDMFSDHDVAFLDMTVQRFIHDGVYAFGYDDSCFIKLLQLEGNALKAISLNTKYSPWLIEDENLFKIVGMVKAGICRTK